MIQQNFCDNTDKPGFCDNFLTRGRASRLAFPGRAWERENEGNEGKKLPQSNQPVPTFSCGGQPTVILELRSDLVAHPTQNGLKAAIAAYQQEQQRAWFNENILLPSRCKIAEAD